ncbi:hypothetical protein PU560_02060 [Georgenia sp. 10Sc9-8]|uniref:YtxH domain-containing protein n=1 Tax=Georgenia halotolerans TaxID=3028317 RepID=A0ABT5TT56_9MICO|nr:hypothetical protein [Georgenia halotolerans]
MSRTGWAVTGLLLLGVTALAAPRARSLRERLRSVPADFRTAYAEREAELRRGLLPEEGAVTEARASTARRRGRAATAAPDDDLPYEFF